MAETKSREITLKTTSECRECKPKSVKKVEHLVRQLILDAGYSTSKGAPWVLKIGAGSRNSANTPAMRVVKQQTPWVIELVVKVGDNSDCWKAWLTLSSGLTQKPKAVFTTLQRVSLQQLEEKVPPSKKLPVDLKELKKEVTSFETALDQAADVKEAQAKLELEESEAQPLEEATVEESEPEPEKPVLPQPTWKGPTAERAATFEKKTSNGKISMRAYMAVPENVQSLMEDIWLLQTSMDGEPIPAFDFSACLRTHLGEGDNKKYVVTQWVMGLNKKGYTHQVKAKGKLPGQRLTPLGMAVAEVGFAIAGVTVPKKRVSKLDGVKVEVPANLADQTKDLMAKIKHWEAVAEGRSGTDIELRSVEEEVVSLRRKSVMSDKELARLRVLLENATKDGAHIQLRLEENEERKDELLRKQKFDRDDAKQQLAKFVGLM